MSALFSPITLAGQTFANRMVVSPMCQYSANDGCMTDWHLQHLAQMAMSGAGLVVVEATGVERRGRITHGCTGLYDESCAAAMARVLGSVRHMVPGAKFGIQLAHAGRKASAQRPWEGGKPLAPGEDPWPTIAPSALALDEGWHTPHAMTADDMATVRKAFVAAARRAADLGYEAIELHGAHGYLLHQFLSPISNKRTDSYGGSLANRMRFPLEVAAAVREVVPARIAFGARITGSDWLEEGWSPDDAATFAERLKELGMDYVGVSSGGIIHRVKIPVGPGYQVPFAAHVRKVTGLPTRTVGMIATPGQAEQIIATGQADMVAMARAILHNPRWGWHAAEALGAKLTVPVQYDRGQAENWPGIALLKD